MISKALLAVRNCFMMQSEAFQILSTTEAVDVWRWGFGASTGYHFCSAPKTVVSHVCYLKLFGFSSVTVCVSSRDKRFVSFHDCSLPNPAISPCLEILCLLNFRNKIDNAKKTIMKLLGIVSGANNKIWRQLRSDIKLSAKKYISTYSCQVLWVTPERWRLRHSWLHQDGMRLVLHTPQVHGASVYKTSGGRWKTNCLRHGPL